MRKWAYLKEPYNYNLENKIYKIMIYETKKDGTYVFLYCDRDAVVSSFDEWYPTLEEAMDCWEGQVVKESWHMIDDPLPGCQDDCVEPVRVKGRNLNKPQWGKLEILKDEKWTDFIFNNI